MRCASLHDRACEKRAQEKISDLAKIYDVHVHKIQRQLFALMFLVLAKAKLIFRRAAPHYLRVLAF